jgi:hypothetical protein
MMVCDEAAARTERARAIGLFRYQLIREAADPALPAKAQGRLVRQIAAGEHLDPVGAELVVHGGDLRYSWQGSTTLFRASPFEAVLVAASTSSKTARGPSAWAESMITVITGAWATVADGSTTGARWSRPGHDRCAAP